MTQLVLHPAFLAGIFVGILIQPVINQVIELQGTKVEMAEILSITRDQVQLDVFTREYWPAIDSLDYQPLWKQYVERGCIKGVIRGRRLAKFEPIQCSPEQLSYRQRRQESQAIPQPILQSPNLQQQELQQQVEEQKKQMQQLQQQIDESERLRRWAEDDRMDAERQKNDAEYRRLFNP